MLNISPTDAETLKKALRQTIQDLQIQINPKQAENTAYQTTMDAAYENARDKLALLQLKV